MILLSHAMCEPVELYLVLSVSLHFFIIILLSILLICLCYFYPVVSCVDAIKFFFFPSVFILCVSLTLPTPAL